jgi:hypothetical protein
MAKQLEKEESLTLEELAVSNSFEIAALVSVLERKGLLTKTPSHAPRLSHGVRRELLILAITE